MTFFERKVMFVPGHNCAEFECCQGSEACKPGSGGFHGIHGLTVQMAVIHNNRGVVFAFHIGDLVPGRLDEMGHVLPLWRPSSSHMPLDPGSTMAWDLGFHSPEPVYKDQTPLTEDCDITGGRCYYDGSSLGAGPVLTTLTEYGGEAVWTYLEKYWNMTFADGERPELPKSKLVLRSGKGR